MVEAMLKSFFVIAAINFIVAVVMCLLANEGYYSTDEILVRAEEQLLKINMLIAVVCLGVILAADISIKTVIEVAK